MIRSGLHKYFWSLGEQSWISMEHVARENYSMENCITRPMPWTKKRSLNSIWPIFIRTCSMKTYDIAFKERSCDLNLFWKTSGTNSSAVCARVASIRLSYQVFRFISCRFPWLFEINLRRGSSMQGRLLISELKTDLIHQTVTSTSEHRQKLTSFILHSEASSKPYAIMS